MRRLLAIAALLCSTLPSAVEAQPRLRVGGGFTSPSGDLSDVADSGYNVLVGLQFGLPTLPIGLRADGSLHRLGSAMTGDDGVDVLAGALSVVFILPGVGLEPYILGGLGTYRVTAGPASMRVSDTNRGYHAGFGVVTGDLGFGLFAELRYVRITGDEKARMIPLTLGFRF